MQNRVVKIPARQKQITASPGFVKKQLSDYKLDIIGLCGFGCKYCFANWGNYLRIKREDFADLTEEQLGERIYPDEDPALTFEYTDIVDKLESELSKKKKSWGEGKTLVFSMLTDGFSPNLLKEGITRQILALVIEKTSFRIRILTKNSVVGNADWIRFFSQHKDRFLVGISIGTLDSNWTRKLETGTSLPQARIRAHQKLQEAEIPTFGMLCPVFPDSLENGNLEKLIDAINPTQCEEVFAEPYNDRNNWKIVASGFEEGSGAWSWFNEVFGRKNMAQWSEYARDLHNRIKSKADAEGWLDKLKYLLYEEDITEKDAKTIGLGSEVLLQSKPYDEDKLSKNVYFAKLQGFSLDLAVDNQVKTWESKLAASCRQFKSSWLDMSQHLIDLKEGVEQLTIEKGYSKNRIWQAYLGVDSYSDYCKVNLNLDKRTCDQMIRARKYFAANNTKLLTQIEKAGEIPDAVATYSTISILETEEVQDKLAADEELREAADKLVFEERASRNELMQFLSENNILSKSSPNYKLFTKNDEVQDFINSIKSRFTNLKDDQSYSDEFSAGLETVIESLTKLLEEELLRQRALAREGRRKKRALHSTVNDETTDMSVE